MRFGQSNKARRPTRQTNAKASTAFSDQSVAIVNQACVSAAKTVEQAHNNWTIAKSGKAKKIYDVALQCKRVWDKLQE